MDRELEERLSLIRAEMVESQLRQRGISDGRVLAAMARVPRHVFVPEPLRDAAYTDRALPLGPDQTISQPYMVAFMLQAARIKPEDRVLEIGTGSGYQTALLSELCREVYSVEIDLDLLIEARRLFEKLEISNVQTRCSDGYKGWPEHQPYDVILVTAAPELVPRELVAELAPGGRFIIPLGEDDQLLVRFERTPEGLTSEELAPVRFVPMKQG